ncbi:MAG TPA: MFS transporter [Acidimicrobiia bacterium]|nr:MFS transporter [Acidimicrobiia bacterium]
MEDGMVVQATEPARRWWVLAVMSVGTMIVFLDDTIVNTALPRISVDLRAGTSGLQWVVDAYVLVLAGLLMLCGSLGDRYGRKRMMTIGLIVFAGASSGAALSNSLGSLIAMRALQGLGAAMVLPATLSIITNVFPRHERGRAIAVWTAVGGVAVGLGPVVGGYLIDASGWSSVFWLQVPVALAALAGMVIVPESRDERHVGLDVPGALLGTLALTTLVYAIIRAGETSFTDTVCVAAFVAAAVLLAAFAYVERRTASPMLPMRFFRERDFSGAVLVIGMALFAMFVSFFFLTQLFQLVQHRSALAAGLLIVPASVGIVIGSGLAAKLIHTLGPRVLVSAMTVGMIAGLLLLTRTTVTTSALKIDSALILFGLGAGLGLPALTDTVMAAVPEREAGIGSAVNDVSRQLGGALGVAVIGSVVSSAYRTNLQRTQPAGLAPTIAHAAQKSIGVATESAAALPTHTALALTNAANTAYVHAITRGFFLSAAVMAAALIVALAMLPTRMRAEQNDTDDTSPDDHSPSRRDGTQRANTFDTLVDENAR